MEESSSGDDVISNDDHDDCVTDILFDQKAENTSPCSSYTIEVCQGPDCTGLGGGIAILEIEELVQEHEHQQHQNGCVAGSRIQVVPGGCRDFCSVGPNAHVLHRRKKQQRGRSSTSVVESFQKVSDASSCDDVVNRVIACLSKNGPTNSFYPGFTNENAQPSSESASSMLARRAERTRWEALKDVSRTIAKSKRVVSTLGTSSGNVRKLRIWKESCQERISRATSTPRPSQRDQRRTKRLIEIASQRLDCICLQPNDESESSNSSNSSNENSNTSHE